MAYGNMERHAHRRPLPLHSATASRVSTAQDGRQAAKRPAHHRQLSQPQLKRHAAAKPSAASLHSKGSKQAARAGASASQLSL